MNVITEPLRLAVGNHKAGSGKGCAMNVISWESGDTTITDLPSCSDPMLARVVQNVNDAYCTHRDGDLLCPPCSVEVLALAHRTAGTALPEEVARPVWVRLAREEADSVAHLIRTAHDATPPGTTAYAAHAALAAVRAHHADATAAAAAAADAAAFAAATAAAALAAAATDADALATAHADADAAAMRRAHNLIDRFEAYTGVKAPTPQPERTAAAITAMTGHAEPEPA